MVKTVLHFWYSQKGYRKHTFARLFQQEWLQKHKKMFSNIIDDESRFRDSAKMRYAAFQNFDMGTGSNTFMINAKKREL